MIPLAVFLILTIALVCKGILTWKDPLAMKTKRQPRHPRKMQMVQKKLMKKMRSETKIHQQLNSFFVARASRRRGHA